LEIEPSSLAHPMDPLGWPAMRERFTQVFRGKTQEQWSAIFDGTDACVTPVLGLGDMEEHPHVRERAMLFRGPTGVPQPAPAPRLSRTPGRADGQAPGDGEHTREVLGELGFGGEQIADWTRAGVIADAG
jgi:alpha-methylacyl-CoA racemase